MGVKLQKHEREVLKKASAIVGALGGRCDVLPGRHNKLVISLGGKKRSTPLSSSPKQVDSFITQTLCDVRRILRQMEMA